ncbi:demethoxyubiquinone hydroxylase family protein [Kiloniella laminariae]|uniref:Demethoxyubiquinone hydroxylase family protein n=1 Tax=Kiloniella laminariae TaxID=454162 RepID=A0ABT4LKB3_9PROT|nr:demethoxyubiquinone hydroxylase family protein [Kiloniella laminariae]MCZ4280437.1 demethoxyubiquinone hydroxylase family protein [Kiloniella laminariae]
MNQEMDLAAAKTIRRIVKVNHAGEYGAIRIYRAQIWVARRLYPDTVAFLEETLAHEIDHCQLFRDAMPARQARPCRVMALWGNGGFLLGFVTALMGRQGIWICTAAVEGAVHHHLDDQLLFLKNRDPELHTLIATIQDQELGHLNHALERLSTPTGFWSKALHQIITLSTNIVMWLSTWGDSTRMARELKASRQKTNNQKAA